MWKVCFLKIFELLLDFNEVEGSVVEWFKEICWVDWSNCSDIWIVFDVDDEGDFGILENVDDGGGFEGDNCNVGSENQLRISFFAVLLLFLAWDIASCTRRSQELRL